MLRIGWPTFLWMPLPTPTIEFASSVMGRKPIGEAADPDTDGSGTWPTTWPGG